MVAVSNFEPFLVLSLACSFEVKKGVISTQCLEDGDVGQGLRHRFDFFLHLIYFFFSIRLFHIEHQVLDV